MDNFKISEENLHIDPYTNKIRTKVFVNCEFLHTMNRDEVCEHIIVAKNNEAYELVDIDSFEDLKQYLIEGSTVNFTFAATFSRYEKGKGYGIKTKITELYIKNNINEQINVTDIGEEYIMDIAI